jgi:hypothetical protein
MKIDINEEERRLLLQLTQHEWSAANVERMSTRPDSLEERKWLEYQQEIELLQAKLR